MTTRMEQPDPGLTARMTRQESAVEAAGELVTPYQVPRAEDGTGWLDLKAIRDMPHPTMLLIRDQLERDLVEAEQHWQDHAGEHSGIEYRSHTAHLNLIYAEILLLSGLIAEAEAWLEMDIAEAETAIEIQRDELRSMQERQQAAVKVASERRQNARKAKAS